MKDHFININVEYDIDALSAMYDTPMLSRTGPFVSVNEDITVSEAVSELFDKFNLPLNNSNCSLTTIHKSVEIHTNPGNNGLIIFPVLGELQVEFYSAAPPIVNGLTMLSPNLKDRPRMTAEEVAEIKNSKIASIIVNSPIAINGRRIYSYAPANATIPLVFVLKIPFDVDWKQIQLLTEKFYA